MATNNTRVANVIHEVKAKEDAVERALSYPYPRPPTSYIFQDGQSTPLPDDFVPSPSYVAVLSVGSNASPVQLKRKYGDAETIPVLAVRLHGLDIVYGSLLSAYGCIPATAVASAGTVVDSHVTLLSPAAVTHMHKTEGGYDYCKLVQSDAVRVQYKDAHVHVPGHVFCYVSRDGGLLLDGQSYALAEFKAVGRTRPALGQRDMMDMFIRHLPAYANESRDHFIRRNTSDRDRRVEVMTHMKSTGRLDDCFQLVSSL